MSSIEESYNILFNCGTMGASPVERHRLSDFLTMFRHHVETEQPHYFANFSQFVARHHAAGTLVDVQVCGDVATVYSAGNVETHFPFKS